MRAVSTRARSQSHDEHFLALARLGEDFAVGPATKLSPQNSMPAGHASLSWPTRLTAGDEDSRWRRRGCAGWFPRRRAGVAPYSAFFSRGMPADGGRDRTESPRPAAPSAARLRDTTGPSRSARRSWRSVVCHAAKAEVAGREIEFLVVQRVVGNVHLAVDAEQRAVGVNDGGGVVIEPGGALLEQRGDDDDAEFFGELSARRSVLGPGIGSASLKKRWSSIWQK